jgi:hypothetical protein
VIAIDDDGFVVVIEITVAVALLDHDGFIPVVTFANDVAIAIPPTVGMTGTNGHTDRADTNADLIRAGRHRKGYSSHRNRSYYKTLDHCMLLLFAITGWQFGRM